MDMVAIRGRATIPQSPRMKWRSCFLQYTYTMRILTDPVKEDAVKYGTYKEQQQLFPVATDWRMSLR